MTHGAFPDEEGYNNALCNALLLVQ